VHGLRGAVRVEVLTDRPDERFAPGAVLYREGTTDALTVASSEAVADGPGWRLRFREVHDRTAADGLRGVYLETEAYPDRELERGTYYWHEVVGTAVRGIDGADLGTVRDVYRVGETEVFEVAGGPPGSFDLPAVRAFIRVFAPRRGEIVVDAEALDLRAPREAAPAGDRPRAPRRRPGPRGTRAAGPSGEAPDGTDTRSSG